MKKRKKAGQCFPSGSMRKLVAGLVLAIAGSTVPALQAQSNYTWSPISTSNFWLNSNNWSGGPLGTTPGVDNNPNSITDNHTGDVATFGVLGFPGSQLGINMAPSANSGVGNNTGANQLLSVGAINWNSPTRAITLGKSDNTVATSTLRLNGATVNPGTGALSNVLVSISNSATFDFTIANTIAGGSGTMDVQGHRTLARLWLHQSGSRHRDPIRRQYLHRRS